MANVSQSALYSYLKILRKDSEKKPLKPLMRVFLLPHVGRWITPRWSVDNPTLVGG